MTRRRRSDSTPNSNSDPSPTPEEPGQSPGGNRQAPASDGASQEGSEGASHRRSAASRASSSDSAAAVKRRMEEGLEGIVAAVIQSAQEGNMVAAKMVLDRVAPIEGERPVAFTMRRIQSTKDAREAAADVFAAVSDGVLTIDAAERLIKLLGDFIKTYAPEEFEARLAALEDVALVAP